MKHLSLIALAVFARLLWNRQLAFEEEVTSVVADMQVETLELVEAYADAGELSVVPSNGSHG